MENLTMYFLEKPKVGEACNNCGLCCALNICNAGAFLLKKVNYLGEKQISEPCPALLLKSDGRKICGLISNPTKFLGKNKFRPEVISNTVAFLVGSGSGCYEIGFDEDDDFEMWKIDDLIEKKSKDLEWRNKAEKAVEILVKIRNEI